MERKKGKRMSYVSVFDSFFILFVLSTVDFHKKSDGSNIHNMTMQFIISRVVRCVFGDVCNVCIMYVCVCMWLDALVASEIDLPDKALALLDRRLVNLAPDTLGSKDQN